MIDTWTFIRSSLADGLNIILLYVVQSSGSSPGRKGFVMAVNTHNLFYGTIGGGIMEIKLTELAKNMLLKKELKPILKKQFHDKSHDRNQSGMICSGEQTIAIIPLYKKDIDTIDLILASDNTSYLNISDSGLQFSHSDAKEFIHIQSESEFECVTSIEPPRRIHIFGGGHVGVALSRQMNLLGYRVILYDDRPDLATLDQETSLYEVKIIDYENLSASIQHRSGDLAVIVSFGYRSDKTILKEIYTLPFAYIGMMGSDSKIAALRAALNEEGISDADLDSVIMPIGLPIYSKTASEIAVSIAAEIILKMNKDLPTGRGY